MRLFRNFPRWDGCAIMFVSSHTFSFFDLMGFLMTERTIFENIREKQKKNDDDMFAPVSRLSPLGWLCLSCLSLPTSFRFSHSSFFDKRSQTYEFNILRLSYRMAKFQTFLCSTNEKYIVTLSLIHI